MVEHISNPWKLQDELHLMENKVPDGSEDHIIIGIMEQLYVFIAFFLDLVLMSLREVEILLVEMVNQASSG